VAALVGKAGLGVKMEKTLLSLPTLPPLKGGEVVKVKEKDIFLLLVKPLEDEPEAYSGVPLAKRPDGAFEPVPVDLLVHEELIEKAVWRVPSEYLQKIKGIKRYPVDNRWRDSTTFLSVIWELQVGSEYCLTEPWQRVVVCKKATILISKEADVSLLRFSRFGKASVKELPSGELEVVLTAGAAYFSGRVEDLPDGGVVKKGAPVKVFVGGEEVLLEEDEDLVLYVREGEDLLEVRVIF
jgi:hypothetical protein